MIKGPIKWASKMRAATRTVIFKFGVGKISLRHSPGQWVCLEENRKNVSCVICVWPLKRRTFPISLIPTGCSVFLTNRRPDHSGTILQLCVILSTSTGAYCLLDSSRKVLEAFSKWEYIACFSSILSFWGTHGIASSGAHSLRREKASVPCPRTQVKTNPTAECLGWRNSLPL